MKTELNNTGILLADLNETEIKLAIELYKLAGRKIDDDPDTLFRNDDARVIGDFDGLIGYWYGDDKSFITLHQLAFESGLNPDWADEIVHTGTNLFWYGDNQGKPLSTGIELHGNGDIIIKKQTAIQCETVFESVDVFNDNHQPELKPQNSYEFVMHCKRTGKPFIADVYSILKAFPERKSPEVEHSIKKTFNAGKRNGGKSYRQDIEEARNQLNQELDYLDRVESHK